MFPVNIVHRLRLGVVSQSLRNLHITAWRHGAVPTGSGSLRGDRDRRRRQQIHGDTRSILYTTYQPCRLSARCLSTATHSEEGNLIYAGNLGIAVRGVKLFSYSTSGASLFLMPHILLKTGLVVQSFAMKAAFCGVIGFFTFLTPVLLHLITKGYVIRLYHNSDRDTYTAITYSVLLTEKKSVFHQRQVRIPAVSKMFTTFYADKMGLLVNPDMFPFPQDYNHLMGYDKPFSFDADDVDGPDKS